MPVERLVFQGYRYERLRNSFKKFYGRYGDQFIGQSRTHSLLIPNSNGLPFFDFFNLDLSLGLSTHLTYGWSDKCRARGRWCLLYLEHMIVLSAGLTSHFSIK